MPKNQDLINKELYGLLKSRGYRPDMYDSSGKKVPIPEEAEAFQFEFIKDGKNYGKATVTIDGLHKLVVYYNDDIASSPKASSDDSLSWGHLIRHLKRFSQQHQLSFELSDQDNLEYDMAKREHQRKEELSEGYHPMGRKASYNDKIPETKIIIKHNRNIEEGEQRFRNVERIFIETSLGERILAPTTKPGIAEVYARHIAEGGLPHDERWKHIGSLVEEYTKMAGFVRATRGGQFNESVHKLVTEGVNHYLHLRESLGKMRGKKGYNAYFESWTPPLMEDEITEDLSSMFMSSSLDPRIESVMPILSKLNRNLSETQQMSEVTELEEWAESTLTFESDKEEADYGPEYQDMVARVGAKAKAQEKKKPTDIKDLARRLNAVKLKDQNKEKLDEFLPALAGIAGAELGGAVAAELGAGEIGTAALRGAGSMIGKSLAPDNDTNESLTPVATGHKGLNKQQKAAGQLGATDKVSSTGPILGAKPKNQKELRNKFFGAESKSSSNENVVTEGEANLEKALEKLHGNWSGWYPDDYQSDPNVKTYWYDDGEGGFYADGTIEHNLKTGEIKVDFKDKDGSYGDDVQGTFNSVGEVMNALRGGSPSRRNTKAPNLDTLGHREPVGPDDLYKTDSKGKKGTLKKVRADTMKASSPYRMRGGPKGVLPEGQQALDAIKRLMK